MERDGMTFVDMDDDEDDYEIDVDETQHLPPQGMTPILIIRGDGTQQLAFAQSGAYTEGEDDDEDEWNPQQNMYAQLAQMQHVQKLQAMQQAQQMQALQQARVSEAAKQLISACKEILSLCDTLEPNDTALLDMSIQLKYYQPKLLYLLEASAIEDENDMTDCLCVIDKLNERLQKTVETFQ